MGTYLIGQRLRTQVQQDRQLGRPLDARRLQGMIADLCGDEQRELIAPLRYLLMSSAFSSAAGMDPPLADGRHLQRLSTELSQMYSPAICLRMQPLLEGLLGMETTTPTAKGMETAPESSERGVSRLQAVNTASPEVAGYGSSAAATEQWRSVPTDRQRVLARGGGGTAVNAVLAFLSGVLLMALAGMGLLAWQRANGTHPDVAGSFNSLPRPAPTASTQTEGSSRSEIAANATEAPDAATHSEGKTVLYGDIKADEDKAVASLQRLYQALSSKDFNQAQALYEPSAADQFRDSFYSQFERVSVQDLRVTSQTGSTLNMEGVVRFVWPDGSLQRETRSFSVDTSSVPALITASEFGRVLSPRR